LKDKRNRVKRKREKRSKPGSKSLKEGKKRRKNHWFWNNRIAVLVVLMLVL
jgi:hypothetical protein